MADKLDWMNKHLIVIRYVTLKEVIEKESYKIRPDLEELFKDVHGTEEMIYKFADLERYKSAVELMAYVAHKRAAVWWGYRCVLSLMEELKINPAEERDISDIGANLEPEVPDWAKEEPPQASPEQIADVQAQLAQAQADYEKMRAANDPRMLKYVEDLMGLVMGEFRAAHGTDPMDLIKQLGEKIKQDPQPIDPNSPIFVETAKLKAEIGAMQKETVDTIKSVIPPKVPEHQKKLQDNALSAVFRWVAAPDGENSQKCLNVGNECVETPAGLLSLSAFWAFGDLMPLGEHTVPTPPGLAANGLCQVFLLCSLHPGGTRKLKERYEEYFNLGMEVLTGADNWEPYLAAGKAPHEEEVPVDVQAPKSNEPESPKQAADESPAPPPTYKRWKPGEPNEEK